MAVNFHKNYGYYVDYIDSLTKEQTEPNLDFQRFIKKMTIEGNIHVTSILRLSAIARRVLQTEEKGAVSELDMYVDDSSSIFNIFLAVMCIFIVL